MNRILTALFVAAMAVPVLGTPVMAQDTSGNIVGSETDWSVFLEEDPRQCWVVSTPAGWTASRGGADVTADVRRGEIMMFVTFWPSDERLGEVSFTGGYPFAGDSSVTIEIGDTSFEMFTAGEMAWAESPEQDQQIIAAMKRGAEAVLTARSSRGTETRDTFSLLGFTAAVEDAETRCGSQ